MRNVSGVIVAVNKTVGELEATVSHFKSNPGGTVMLAGHTYPGFIPSQGRFATCEQTTRGCKSGVALARRFHAGEVHWYITGLMPPLLRVDDSLIPQRGKEWTTSNNKN